MSRGDRSVSSWCSTAGIDVRVSIAAALGEDLAAELAQEGLDDPQLDGAVRHRGIAERDSAHRGIAHGSLECLLLQLEKSSQNLAFRTRIGDNCVILLYGTTTPDSDLGQRLVTSPSGTGWHGGTLAPGSGSHHRFSGRGNPRDPRDTGWARDQLPSTRDRFFIQL